METRWGEVELRKEKEEEERGEGRVEVAKPKNLKIQNVDSFILILVQSF